MKKKLLYLMILVCSISIFVACGDDDKDDNKKNVAGAYAGNLNVVLNNGEPIKSTQNIEVTEAGEGKINFVLKNFSLNSEMNVGNIVVTDIELIDKDGKYTFSKNVENQKITAGDAAGVQVWLGPTLLSAGVPLELTGTIEGGTMKANISIPLVTPYPMDIKVSFSGTKK